MEKPVIEYSHGIFAPYYNSIEIFSDGYTTIVSTLDGFKKEDNFYIPSNQVREYAKKLEKAGIFKLKHVDNSPDGFTPRRFVLNWGGKEKTFSWEKKAPKLKGLDEIIKELTELINQ